jgi:hypothetical protein
VRRQAAYGRWQPLTDADPARAHARELRAAGLSAQMIAAMAGVTPRLLHRLLGPGHPARIRPASAEAILAIQPGQRPPARSVPAAGTTRRLRALAVLGWTLADIAREAGVGAQPLSRIAAGGKARVAVRTAEAVARLYDKLWDKPGPSQVSRDRAIAKGWPPALAWDDDDGPHGIDNPDAVPHPWQRPAPAAGQRGAALAEDAGELLAQGHDLAQAAWRLGMKPDSLARALYRQRARERAA